MSRKSAKGLSQDLASSPLARGRGDFGGRGSEAEPPSEAELTFEEALAQLEAVIRDLEDGQLGLNESLARYEEGVRVLRFCHSALHAAERKILLLTAVDESGAAITEPYDDRALSLEEKRDQRTRRRSRSAPHSGSDGTPGAEAADQGETEDDGSDMDRQKGLF